MKTSTLSGQPKVLSPDSRLAQHIRAAAADKRIIQECLRLDKPLPPHIKLFKFPPGTFDETDPTTPPVNE